MSKKFKDNLKQVVDTVVLISKNRVFDSLRKTKKHGLSYQERSSCGDIKTLSLIFKRQKSLY